MYLSDPSIKLFANSSEPLQVTGRDLDALIYQAHGVNPLIQHLQLFDVTIITHQFHHPHCVEAGIMGVTC